MIGDSWPIGTYSDIRYGSHVLILASTINNEAIWSQICNWLSQHPPLCEIETFWVDDNLLVTGVERDA